MKIAHITPGTGGQFYCQNCFRDGVMLESLEARGYEVYKVPLYLPLDLDQHQSNKTIPVFYGAINIYLKEKSSLYRNAPAWVENFFNSDRMLHMAAKMSGSTEASGLEEMTLSMLRGEEGRQAAELDQLILYLRDKIKPEVVHLSNALLLGIVNRVREAIGCKVICSLQDENEWIDPMKQNYQDKVWNLMAEKAKQVDRFIAASHYYSAFSQDKLKIPASKINVVYAGIALERYKRSSLPMDPPVIGYLSRIWERLGLDILVDAVILLKQKPEYKHLQLHITGGQTAEDRPFIKRIKHTIHQAGIVKDIYIFETFDKEDRIEFLKNLTLLSVPVPAGEALGIYQIEALAAGVPIVQPRTGGFPEFMEATKGGVIYEPNSPETLARHISSLLHDQNKLHTLSQTGHRAVKTRFSIQQMVKNLTDVYEDVCC